MGGNGASANLRRGYRAMNRAPTREGGTMMCRSPIHRAISNSGAPLILCRTNGHQTYSGRTNNASQAAGAWRRAATGERLVRLSFMRRVNNCYWRICFNCWSANFATSGDSSPVSIARWKASAASAILLVARNEMPTPMSQLGMEGLLRKAVM